MKYVLTIGRELEMIRQEGLVSESTIMSPDQVIQLEWVSIDAIHFADSGPSVMSKQYLIKAVVIEELVNTLHLKQVLRKYSLLKDFAL
jgi:hypothetical protein